MAKNPTPTKQTVPVTAGIVIDTPEPSAPMRFAAALHFVENRGRAPIWFLEALVAWGRTAPAEIFAPNNVPDDIYARILPYLGTPMGKDDKGNPLFVWDNEMHRRASMLEDMRVHAGLESSWNPREGVDKTNRASQRNIKGQEAGLFQVSFDVTWLDSVEGKDIMGVWLKTKGIDTPEKFIAAMKRPEDGLDLEFETYARAVRVSCAWAGPLIRHNEDSVYPYLSRDSMREFLALL